MLRRLYLSYFIRSLLVSDARHQRQNNKVSTKLNKKLSMKLQEQKNKNKIKIKYT